MPFQTPEVKVGDVYPRLGCSSSPDSVASPETEDSFWNLKKRKINSEAKRLRHSARKVLQLGGDMVKKARHFKKRIKKKIGMDMKWYPGDKAREAEKEIRKIDPGYGYKIVIVRDTSVPPPAMPKTPPLTPSPERPCLNQVLMDGARARVKPTEIPTTSSPICQTVSAVGKNEKTAFNAPSTSCIGCGLGTCLNKFHMDTAVASFASLKQTKAVVMMSRDKRVEWFVDLYKSIDPKNSTKGLKCATKYAEKNMRYLTAMYIMEKGLADSDGADDDNLTLNQLAAARK